MNIKYMKLTFIGFTEDRHKESFIKKGFEQVSDNFYKKITNNLEISVIQKKRFGFMEVIITKKEQGIKRTAALEEFAFSLVLQEAFQKQVKPDYLEIGAANIDEDYLAEHWIKIPYLPNAWQVQEGEGSIHKDWDNEVKLHTYRICVEDKKELQFYDNWFSKIIKTTVVE